VPAAGDRIDSGLRRPSASALLRCLHLRFQTVAVLIKNKVHASVGPAGFFIEAAEDLLFLICSGANGYLFRAAEVGPRVGGHRGVLFCGVRPKATRHRLIKDIATSPQNLRRNSFRLKMSAAAASRRCDIQID
jgi:hypothetical protein